MRSLWPLLAAGLLALAGCRDDPFRLTVLFPETGGLKPGDNVVLRGLSIGQVADIDIEADGVAVRVEIRPRYREHLQRGVVFRVAPEKMITGKQMLVVEPAAEPGPPLPAGARVRGGPIEPDPVERVRDALHDSIDHARDQAKGLGRALLDPDQLPPRAVGGTVDLDRPRQYALRLLSVRVHPTKADGADWDGLGGGGPDLVAQVWVGSRQVMLAGPAEDTLEAEWADRLSEPFDLPPDTRLSVKILDQDVGFNDLVGVIELSPTPADAAAGRLFRLAAGRVAEVRLRVEERPPDSSP